MMAAANYAPGNAGTVFYTDIFLPIIGLALVWLQHRLGQDSRSLHTGPATPSP
jgi:hypothetical protein